ncbi:MAG: EutN/CcmL family microcompartment protein [Clostridia bacterium]|nr:EutN/CcmL family microcompartment protein [Clostridia bacterium]
MRTGKVCGSIWATKKHEQLNGAKFLEVELSDGTTVIATDTIGAGIGDTVLLTFGRPASDLSPFPTDIAVCGIVDKT